MKYTKNWYVICNNITRPTLQDFFEREGAWKRKKKDYSYLAKYGWLKGEYRARAASESVPLDWEEISFEEFLSTIYAPIPMYEIY